MKSKYLMSTLCAAALAGSAMVAYAADGPHDDAIKARQAMFQTYSFNLGVLGAMAKGKMDYDASLAAESAANLEAAANFGQSAYWPAGSDSETDGNATTRALPAIWEDMAGVGEKAQALKDAAANMSLEAGNGLDALRGAMGDLGGACKGCHDNYRADKK